MKRSASLEVLENYAKTLTKKLVNMLYESKMNKKYSKRLYESYDDMLSLYIDAYILDDNEISVSTVINAVKEAFGNKVVIEESITGLMIYTNDLSEYTYLLCLLEELGIPTEVLTDVLDNKYLNN